MTPKMWYLIIAVAIFIAFLAPIMIETFVSRSVHGAMSTTLESVDPEIISEDTARTNVHCERIKFEKICQETYVYQKEGTTGNLKAKLSNQDIETYINELAGRLEKEGWEKYKLDPTDFSSEAFSSSDENTKTLYYVHSKSFGRTKCEVLTNYALKDPVSNLSPSMYQKISCKQVSI